MEILASHFEHFRSIWFDEAAVVLGWVTVRSEAFRALKQLCKNFESRVECGALFVMQFEKTPPVKRIFSMLLM